MVYNDSKLQNTIIKQNTKKAFKKDLSPRGLCLNDKVTNKLYRVN